MNFPFFIAKRYINYNKGSKFFSLISLITIGGIGLGITVLIIAISILNGFENSISENIIKFNSHINISGYSDRNLLDHRLVETRLKSKIEGVYSEFSSYISKKVIISKKNLAEGILLNGIEPEFAVNSLSRIVKKGEIKLDENGIIIGQKLADKFNLDINNKLTVFALNNDQPPSLTNLPIIDQFKVVAIYESGMAEYDDIYAYINFNTAANFFELDDEVSGYNINLYDISKIDSIKTELSKMLSYPFYVRSYRDINKHIFTWLELQQKPIPIVLGLIIIVAVFNIVGAVLMLIIQKTDAIGVLRSMGANGKQIIQIFMFQGVTLALTGILLGNALALLLSWLQNEFKIITLPEQIYYLSSVPIEIKAEIYLLVSVLGFLLAVITSFLPSYIASRIQPITAIKFN
ncbi:MAG: ABC transporter permease [Ignavibacteriales bacterium]|nr:ABC transporter permease [Ignavibacteriales bacterium]MCB9218761.1 ABC transporter permease [Ignavibacteriales bacterium]